MDNRKPQVSLGLPVYNGEKYLEKTIDSILAQTYRDFELIICDNGSNDRTQEVCEYYCQRDERVKYHRNPKNIGIAPNYNKAFELSSGKYFKWADYDDILAPEFIAKTVAVLDQYPDVSVAFPKTKFIDGNGDLLEDFEPPDEACSSKAHIRFKSLILNPDHIVSQASGLMRSEIVRRSVMNGSYPCSDEVLIAHLSLLGIFYEIPEHLFFYRLHARQSTKGVLASERARVVFYDTSLEGKIVLIKWLYLKTCMFAIWTAPISFFEKIMCTLYMGRWMFVQKNLRSLTKDLLLAIHERIPIFPKLYQETLDMANVKNSYR